MKRIATLLLPVFLLAVLLGGCGSRQRFEGQYAFEDGITGSFDAEVQHFDDEYLLASEEFRADTVFKATVEVGSFAAAGEGSFQLVVVLPKDRHVVLYDSDENGAPYQGEQLFTCPAGLAEVKLVGLAETADLQFSIARHDIT